MSVHVSSARVKDDKDYSLFSILKAYLLSMQVANSPLVPLYSLVPPSLLVPYPTDKTDSQITFRWALAGP